MIFLIPLIIMGIVLVRLHFAQSLQPSKRCDEVPRPHVWLWIKLEGKDRLKCKDCGAIFGD